eukprot:9228308-Ditylum_brightwellii.AAC.1
MALISLLKSFENLAHSLGGKVKMLKPESKLSHHTLENHCDSTGQHNKLINKIIKLLTVQEDLNVKSTMSIRNTEGDVQLTTMLITSSTTNLTTVPQHHTSYVNSQNNLKH